MSYLALYRKYRPRTFDEVVGQEHIVRTLQNQIKTERISHAYLFTGSRGTGKTTIAKIFARAVNCTNPANGSACMECEACKQIEDGGSINIIELDAASHNGVDNIREINEEVKYSPAVGKYKVYIIDEVHMLSTGAFNALLKTLEEPPAHVIFILATTDPQKIPVTILSRCQRFDFKRIPASQISHTLHGYMNEEHIDIEDEALDYIARLADGGMRDALSILEQCISFYFDEHITVDKVLYLVGAVDTHYLFDMIDALIAYNSTKALEVCDQVNIQGRSIRQFAVDLLVHVRNLLVVKTTQGQASVLDYSKEYIAKLEEQASRTEVGTLMHYIKVFSELDSEIKVASNQRILLEVTVLKLSEAVTDAASSGIEDKLLALQAKLEKLEAREPMQVVREVSAKEPEKEIVPTRLPEAVPEDIKELVGKWDTIKNQLGTAARLVFKSTSAGLIEGDIFYIVHGVNMEPSINSHIEEVRALINKTMQKEVKVVPIAINNYEMKTKEVHGTKMQQNDVTDSISGTLRDIYSKINYKIETIN